MSPEGVEQLREHEPLKLAGAALAGADLSGMEIADCALLGADLAGADLTGAHLVRVDLRLADLRGACLEGATLEMVVATGAILQGVEASRARLNHVRLVEADLRAADLREAMLDLCTLERADLDDCDLTRAYLVHSLCEGTTFQRARLERLTTLGSSFPGADFSGARDFSTSNEIVSEILLREAGGDLRRIMECAAVVADRERCYAEWKEYVEQHPDAGEFAFGVFARYPESGCAEALRRG